MKKLTRFHTFTSTFLVLLSLCLWSCQKNDEIGNAIEDQAVTNTQFSEVSGQFIFELPAEAQQLSQKEQVAYITTLSAQTMADLHEETRIKAFLMSNSLYQSVAGRKLADTDPSSFLNINQLAELADYETTTAGCAEGVYKYEWAEACRNNQLVRQGNIYKCEHGRFTLVVEANVQETGIYCSDSESCTTGATYSYDPTDFCNASGNFTAFDNATLQRMALYVSKEMPANGHELLQVYIRNQDEIEAVFTSNDPKYGNLQESVRDFLLVNDFLINKGFQKSTTATVGAQHIEVANRVLQELEASIDSPELKVEIQKISTQVQLFKGKKLKNALSDLGM